MPTYSLSFGTFSSTGVGDAVWNTPSKADVLDGVFAISVGAIGAPSTSRTLLCTAPTSAIPAGEIVTGVTYNVHRKASHATAGSFTSDLHINPVIGGVIQTGVELASASHWPTAVAAASYGGGTLMGLASITVDSGFGLAVRTSMTDGDFSGADGFVDFVQAVVTTVKPVPIFAAGILPPFSFGA